MRSVTVKAGKKYEVLIGTGILDSVSELIAGVTKTKHVIVVSDDNVYPLYGQTVVKKLEDDGYQVERFVFPHGEASKNLSVFGELQEKMCDAHLSREDLLIAVGGGVVGDLAGFAAATYQRGIPFVQIPTTLLAAVDSSVGGKTAVDLPNGKNQVGCFYQPSLVICDPTTLSTLPDSEYRNGCAEIIKYGVLDSEELFEKILQKPVCEQYEEIIERCVSIKRDYVEEDEFDRGKRMLLNYGHTIAHAIEACSRYEIPHGQAVAIGMVMITKASAAKGLCDPVLAKRVENIVRAYGLPYETGFAKEDLSEAGMADKKNTSDSVRLVVPEAIGGCTVRRIPRAEFITWLQEGGAV